jgi:putative transposase
MSRYRRASLKGGSYFFTVVSERRQRILTNDDVRATLREAITEVRRQHPFHIDAWGLLPDHLHCIWSLPEGDADFSTRWRKIKAHVTRHCGARYRHPEWLSARRQAKGQGTLWQQRFWEHCLRDEADWRRHVDYLHWNPVKHGVAGRVVDWPWSSFHRFVAEGLYEPGWGEGVAPDQELKAGEMQAE